MSSNNLLRFGVPVARQAAPGGVSVPVRSQTGQCGIEPYKRLQPQTPPQKVQIPDHLIRPPCLPGDAKRPPPDCARGSQGLYCPPQRLKYKYPPFSENIDFVPTGTVECWWTRPPKCDLSEDEEENLPFRPL